MRARPLVLALAVAVAALATLWSPSAQATSTFQFAAKVAYAAGKAPESVVTGDLNGDRHLDLLTANTTANSVSVLLGKGDGTFAAQVEYETGKTPTSAALADLNGDGKPDILTANTGSNTVSVLLGKGNGTFEKQVEYETGKAPASVALADLNGDGKPDIVTANTGSNTVSVLLGKGDGTFAKPVEYSTGEAPVAVALADLNADGKPDILTANTTANSVSVLLGKGDGTFVAQVEYETGKTPTSAALADLNGDGKPDIVTADSGANSVSVLLGKGNGTFATKQDFATGATPRSVALADLNGDGKPDIVTANTTDNDVSALLNASVAALEASPGSLTFGNQLYGTKSSAQKVTVTNTGSAVLAIGSVAVAGNFAASGCSGLLLPSGASCSITVTFAPKGYGSLKGEATITTNAGSDAIKLSGTGLPPSPSAATGPVGAIFGTYVTLTGTVISQGPGSFYFQYGSTTAYGSVTPTFQLSSTTNPQLLAATLSLAPGTYHYRIVATNLAATAYGADQAFTIPPESPLLRMPRHGRLRSVLKRGLRLRLADSSPATILVKLQVDPSTARATHLIPARSKRKTKVTVGSLRVSVAANRFKTVTVRLTGAARHRLAALRRLKLTVSATAIAEGVASLPTRMTAVVAGRVPN
jgi:hypothetical protein